MKLRLCFGFCVLKSEKLIDDESEEGRKNG